MMGEELIKRAYYSKTIAEFLDEGESPKDILETIRDEAEKRFDVPRVQEDAWREEIRILKTELKQLDLSLDKESRILFEYTIPRMGERTDVVLLYRNIVFILEFKCGETQHSEKFNRALHRQVLGYAQDLHNFHEKSYGKLLVPIMVPTHSRPEKGWSIEEEEPQRIIKPLKCRDNNIARAMNAVIEKYDHEAPFDDGYKAWENSKFFPAPTIVEATQALVAGCTVKEITRSLEENGDNLNSTIATINDIIEDSKPKDGKPGKKSICFVTGVPGAGKTLIGLYLAVRQSKSDTSQRAVLLSGNYPLVTVLRKSLVNNKLERDKEERKKKQDKVSHEVSVNSEVKFVDMIHRYRDECYKDNEPPAEHVVIFDEAQRAWTKEKIGPWMKRIKGREFPYSEPQFLISTLNRHKDWAVIICLVGGGQEIHNGEAGLPEWFDSLRSTYDTFQDWNFDFHDWDVYVASDKLNSAEYLRGRDWEELKEGLNIINCDKLHLNTDFRSFRAQNLAAFVNALLDATDADTLKNGLYHEIEHPKVQQGPKGPYPIRITRDLNKAKDWVKAQCGETSRCGLIASSGAIRLRPEGIFVQNVRNSESFYEGWFLGDEDDVRSSHMLEEVMTEFGIQGLELDYCIVAWDADYRYVKGKNGEKGKWTYHRFGTKKWNDISKDNEQKSYENQRRYLKNTYRVLLTRARQGMVIFIPTGSEKDATRLPAFYNDTYNYLKAIGLKELE